MKDDWTRLDQSGYGLKKRENKNQRVAQFKVANYKFAGGIYSSVIRGNDFKQAEHVTEMMSWPVLCAKYTEQAIIADIVIDIVCVDVMDVCVYVNIVIVCVCVSKIHQAVQKCLDAGELKVKVDKGKTLYGFQPA